MRSAERSLRVVVQDPRRLLREGLAAILGAEQDIALVAAVSRVEDVAEYTDQLDVVVCVDAYEAPLESSVRVLRLTDEDPVALLLRLRNGDEEVLAPRSQLTPRENQIMRGVADGMSTGQIGAVLGISPKTVENHKQRIFTKLGVQSQTHAVVTLHAAGLLVRAESSA